MSASASAALQDPNAATRSETMAAAATGGERPAGGDLRLAQLLCSRLCHDLIGAAGAISNGIELLDDEAADTADIHDLLGLSGRQLNRRLAFYRHAFAMDGSHTAASFAEARRLASDFLTDTRIVLNWSESGIQDGRAGGGVSTVVVRMALCTILIAAEGLPRGGTLSVRIAARPAGTTLTVEGEGRDAALPQAVRTALSPPSAADAMTARTVPAYYLSQLARESAMHIDVQAHDGGFTLRIDPLHA